MLRIEKRNLTTLGAARNRDLRNGVADYPKSRIVRGADPSGT